MSPISRVALVRSDRRRGAIAQALNLIADDLRAVVRPEVLLKPNLVCQTRQLPSTHPDALSATLDALLAAGATSVKIAEGASDARAGFDALGHAAECFGRPVEFFDINKDETAWDTIVLRALDGSPLETRVSRTIAEAGCRVSLALMKTHVTPSVTMSLKNMLSSIHPKDRVRMHGFTGGNGASGWKRPIIEFLKGDTALVTVLTRLQGRVRNVLNALAAKNGSDGWKRLSKADLSYLRSVMAMHHNLVRLTARVKPHVSVLDGFWAMHREGPKHGTPIKLGLAVAGTDAVAVDAVGVAAMGFDPMQIGYLKLAHEAGLGIADLSRIEIVGDPLAKVTRRCVPHSNFAIQRHWERVEPLAASSIPSPHFASAQANRPSPR
jgi:uncharacterized protein (DUF362 family)